MTLFPLPWSAGLCRHSVSGADAHGNPVEVWAPPEPVPCCWWIPSSDEPPVARHDRVVVDLIVCVDVALTVSPRDRIEIPGASTPYEVVGEPADYNHGPFGFAPYRLLVECRKVVG